MHEETSERWNEAVERVRGTNKRRERERTNRCRGVARTFYASCCVGKKKKRKEEREKKKERTVEPGATYTRNP